MKTFTFKENYEELPPFYDQSDSLERFRKSYLLSKETRNIYKISPFSGLLAFGAPGCGKTLFVKTLAQMTGLPYKIIRKDFFSCKDIEIPIYLQKQIEVAAQLKSSILIIEDVETLVPNRETIKEPVLSYNTATILPLIKDCKSKGIMIFATSSRPQDIDLQLLTSDYLGELYYLEYPDEDTRMKLVELYLSDRPHQEDIDYCTLSKKTPDYSPSDILHFINQTALTCALQSIPISMSSLLDTLSDSTRPVSTLLKPKYIELCNVIGNRQLVKAKKKKIGF